jgi:hypothetical protein
MIICLFKFDDKIYLLANEESKCIQGFKSVKAGLAYFEDAYHANHARSYEASMSACVNFIMFQPSIVQIKSYKELKEKIVDEKNFAVFELRNVAGWMVGISTRPEAEKYWEEGTVPALVEMKKSKYKKPNLTSEREYVWQAGRR